jgi:hypothetical protein
MGDREDEEELWERSFLSSGIVTSALK